MGSFFLHCLITLLTALFFLTCHVFHSGTALAGTVFLDAAWQSAEIDGPVYGSTLADVNGDGARDVVTVLRKRAVVHSLAVDGSLMPLVTVAAGVGEDFHRVFAGDFNRDGEIEILLDGFAREKPFARLVAIRGGQQVVTQEFKALVTPLFWQGEERLFSQTMRGRGEWAQFFSLLEWQGTAYQTSQNGIRIAEGVGSNSVSLFAVTGLGDKLAILMDDGFLVVTDASGKKIWRSGLRYGGALDTLSFEDKDPLGMKRVEELPVMPRLGVLRGGSALVVPKNLGFLPAAIGAFSNMRAAQYSVLEWTEGGFQERKASPNYDGAISDVEVVDNDGDGIKNEILLTLWSRKGGVLETSQPKKSLLTVVPSGFPGGFVPPFAVPPPISGSSVTPMAPSTAPVPSASPTF